MEDDHVDRPGVEAQQCVQLTGTNRSIGLIALIFNVHMHGLLRPAHVSTRLLRISVLRRPGGSSEEPQPDPIPNSAVKLFSANGTMAQALGE